MSPATRPAPVAAPALQNQSCTHSRSRRGSAIRDGAAPPPTSAQNSVGLTWLCRLRHVKGEDRAWGRGVGQGVKGRGVKGRGVRGGAAPANRRGGCGRPQNRPQGEDGARGGQGQEVPSDGALGAKGEGVRPQKGRRGERGGDGAGGAGRLGPARPRSGWGAGPGGVVTGQWGCAVERLALQGRATAGPTLWGPQGEWESLPSPLRRLCSPGEMETSSRTVSLLGL